MDKSVNLVRPPNCKFGFLKLQVRILPCSKMLLMNYYALFIFLFFCTILSSLVFFLSFFLSLKFDDREKLTAYECGFNPFEDSRNEFDIRFYLVAILFLIFDLEISFLFPFLTILNENENIAFCSMLLFLFILTVGFFYEWKKGALDWN